MKYLWTEEESPEQTCFHVGFQAGLFSSNIRGCLWGQGTFYKKNIDIISRGSLVAQPAKPPAIQENQVQFLGQEDLLEKVQATHSSIPELPWWLSW